MKYARIDDQRIVREVIPNIDPRFPGIPITARYSPDFLAFCLELPDTAKVEQDMEYLPLENCFVPQIFYTGIQSIALTQGEASFLPVNFSEVGSWAVIQDSGLETQQTDKGLSVISSASGEYEVDVEFTETYHGRIKRQKISISVS